MKNAQENLKISTKIIVKNAFATMYIFKILSFKVH